MPLTRRSIKTPASRRPPACDRGFRRGVNGDFVDEDGFAVQAGRVGGELQEAVGECRCDFTEALSLQIDRVHLRSAACAEVERDLSGRRRTRCGMLP